MTSDSLFLNLRSLVRLREIRSLLRTPRSRGLVALIAVVYAVISLVIGVMLQLVATGSPFGVHVTPVARSADWWNYPSVVVTAPNWLLYLPFLPTVTMVLVSIAVGIAVGASAVLLSATLRNPPKQLNKLGVASGVAPAVAGLATLGACCCTSCAAALSVGVIASVSGTDFYTLLQNNWYLDLFQLTVVGLGLIAMERGLRTSSTACLPPAFNRRLVAGTVFRVSLLIAGMTWSLAMFVEWGEVSPWSATPGLWYHWLFEHQLLAVSALLAALFPSDTIEATLRWAASRRGQLFRGALLVAGVTWGVWVPSAAVDLGLGGFLNEVIGVLGLPASWGAASADALGPALAFHWGFQHLLLGAFAVILALRPSLALRPLAWTVNEAEVTPSLIGEISLSPE